MNKLVWFGSNLKSQGFVLDMVVNGGEKGNLRKTIGKNYLWVGPIQESQGFVLDMVVGRKNFRKICGKNYFGVVQLKNPKG